MRLSPPSSPCHGCGETAHAVLPHGLQACAACIVEAYSLDTSDLSGLPSEVLDLLTTMGVVGVEWTYPGDAP